MKSPLSNHGPEKLRELSRDRLLGELTDYFHSPAPPRIVNSDYTMWRCGETGLEFCDPPIPGNAAFYQWVSSFPSYYPGVRWEYGEVARLIRELGSVTEGFKVLDVGCGRGDFLRTLDFIPPHSRFALDMNEPAIAACREQGFRTCCGTVEQAITSGFLEAGAFPIVTSFHCLEHVSEPVEFVRELLRIIAPGGRLYLSTPYSPMSFEQDWFDVMNHPPHHMTRWNLAAYRKLAELLGVGLRSYAPHTSPLKQALQLFQLKQYGPNVPVSRGRLLKDLLPVVPQFIRTWRQMAARVRDHGNNGADVILVELNKR